MNLDNRLFREQEGEFANALYSLIGCDEKPAERLHRHEFQQPLLSKRPLGAQGAFRDSEARIHIVYSREPSWYGLSLWSSSRTKRIFDCACVLLAAPLVLPLMLLIGAMVRLTSRGPVLFLQKRVGCHGQIFTIFKFRTMEHRGDAGHHPITTTDNQRFTSIGPFLRRWKLDELPQLVNVLLGHMSLIGPRPKLAEHAVCNLPCRPGITGMATILFAKEESLLARVPKDRLREYYHSLVLPMKQRLDAEYMARATFLSDLQILFNSVVRRWGSEAFDSIEIVSNLTDRRDEESPESSNLNETRQRTKLKHLVERMEVSAYVEE